MKVFLKLSLIVSAIFYLAASIYSASFIPFNWQDRGIVCSFWIFALIICGIPPIALFIDEQDKNDSK